MKKRTIYLVLSFVFIMFGALWFLTDNINNLSFKNNIANIARNMVAMLRTVAYIVLLVVSFICLLKDKKMPKLYFVTFIFISYHTLVWIPEFLEYIVSLFKNMNYVITYFMGFITTFIGVLFLGLLYNKKLL